MIDDHRHRILSAAARVYALHGWRGATTRRIADEAGVNEITIFRQFGSKDALLDIAMRESARIDEAATLPRMPVDPVAEINQWVFAHHDGLSSRREMVRKLMSDAAERPDAAACACHGPSSAAAQLREYVVQLRRHGWLSHHAELSPTEVSAAVTMLMGATFADALNRDMMPAMFPQPKDDTLRAYVRIFLRGIGATSEPAANPDRTAADTPTSLTAE